MWEARSLQDFADYPVDELAKRYDLIVLDHPHMGTAARDGCLVPLNKYLSPLTQAALQQESVGKSYQSYVFDGELWALPIDAAAQVAAYRPDLLERLQCPVPRTWDDVIALARVRPGTVSVPLMPTDALMAFFTLCANSGEEPFSLDPEVVVTRKTGLAALEMLRQLASYSNPESLSWNPIQMWESHGDHRHHRILSARFRVLQLLATRLSAEHPEVYGHSLGCGRIAIGFNPWEARV